MFQTKFVEEIETHFLVSKFFRKSYRLYNEVKLCKVGQPTEANAMRRIRFACWIVKTTDSHAEHIVLISFPLQNWLHERASILRLYVTCVPCSFTLYERTAL
jgi:hypothetical protein